MTIKRHTADHLQWFQSSHLAVPHGMFTRQGGMSTTPFESLNLSYGVGDSRKSVGANRNKVKRVLGIQHLISLGQVHGNNILQVGRITEDQEVEGYDGIMTDVPGTGLLIQQADCQAVLLHDPTLGVIGAVHSGWRGSVANIIAIIVQQMGVHYGVQPANLRGLISPSLGPCCAQFIHHREELPTISPRFKKGADHFDFWEISRHQLQQAGLPKANIFLSNICTSCNNTFFSYRRAVRNGSPITGRNGSIIALPSPAVHERQL